MNTIAALLLILIQPMAGTSSSQNNTARTESARPETPDIKITANVPNTSTLELVRPDYSADLHVGGEVVVWVKIDKTGAIISARAISGHPRLKSLAVDAARKSKFKWNSVQSRKYITGRITYIFTSAEIPYNELGSLIGQRVTLRGEFSLRGKVGPYVLVSDKPVYIVPTGSFGWGRRYSRMEGKMVSVTGTLHFFKAPPQPKPTGSIPMAWVSDYFYFEAESARVQIDKP
jgi:hypothetical protein